MAILWSVSLVATLSSVSLVAILWSVSLTTGSLYDKHKDPSRHVSAACTVYMHVCMCMYMYFVCKSHLKVIATCTSGCVSQAYLRTNLVYLLGCLLLMGVAYFLCGSGLCQWLWEGHSLEVVWILVYWLYRVLHAGGCAPSRNRGLTPA